MVSGGEGPGKWQNLPPHVGESPKPRLVQPRLCLVLRLRNSGVQLTFAQGAAVFAACRACVRSSRGHPTK